MILYLIFFLVAAGGYLAGICAARWGERERFRDRLAAHGSSEFWKGYAEGFEGGARQGLEAGVMSGAVDPKHPDLKSLQAQRRGIVEKLN